MNNLNGFSATQLGKLVNAKQISCQEVLDLTEKKIAEVNPKINAIVYTKFDEARKAASKLQEKIQKGENVGPLAGVPVALKDFLPSKKGWPATHGGVKSLQTIDDADSMFCKAAESQGAIVIGKTNAPSFGFRGLTDNYMYGPTSTPFKVGYNSGGSSGGSCAAVSSGLVKLAEVGDAGGSGRIPAAWCLTFGFKPSAGIVPSVCRPDAWTATHPYCCGGPTAQTVLDAATIMDKMTGFDPRDPLSVPIRPKVFSEEMFSSIRGMKIGVTYDFGTFPDPEDEIVNSVAEIAQVLKNAGAQVKEAKFSVDYSLQELEQAWLIGICLDTAIDMELWKKNGFDFKKDHYSDVPKEFFEYNDIAINSNAMDYRKFHDIRTAILDSHVDVFNDCDVVIAPVSGCLPVKNATNGDTKGPDHIREVKVDPLIGFAYTYLENMTGYPAASVPFGLSKEGLPIGIQVIGRRYFDEDVFAVAHAIEELHPWSQLYSLLEESLC